MRRAMHADNAAAGDEALDRIRKVGPDIQFTKSSLLLLTFPCISCQVFDRVSSTLSDGRAFLCGPAPSDADVAFAALTYPLLLPPAAAAIVPALAAAVALRADPGVQSLVESPASQ